MNQLQEYNRIFQETFGLNEEEVKGARYKESEQWDSVGHMTLISALEDQFGIMFDTDDIMELDSYEKGREILKEHHQIDL